jgi:2-C-methyl-D-erythritol 2,4-cyclodiphosphate synthase
MTKPQTLNFKPQTSNLKPQTSNFKPQTSNLKPNYLRIKRTMSFRIGSGVDYHQLEAGRKFMLGGVQIPHHSGASGHSDADVLIHSICDALLGAAALGDIGTHFPDTDQQYKDIDSKVLLKRTKELISKQGYSIVNIDSTICLQEPKIKPFVPQMQTTIAQILGVRDADVSIKATTTEGMGFVGRKEGVVAYATILLQHL